MPEPIARLLPATKTVRELAVDGSVGTDASWATAVLKKSDSSENPTSLWIFRPTRTAIKSDRDALVLFGTEAAAQKDADEKTSAKDKIKRRKLRAAFAQTSASLAGKAKAKTKLASAEARAKNLRGRGLSVEAFARTIAEFS